MVRWPGEWNPELVGKEWIQVSVAGVSSTCCLWTLQTAPALAACMPCLQALFCVQLPLYLQPTYAYLMPAYKLGSVASLLGDICHR